MTPSDVRVGDRVGALVLADRLAETGNPDEARWRALAGDEDALQSMLDADPADGEVRTWLSMYLAAAGDRRAAGYAALAAGGFIPDPPPRQYPRGWWGWIHEGSSGDFLAHAPGKKAELPVWWWLRISQPPAVLWKEFATRRAAADAAA